MKSRSELSPKALERWNPGIMAASSDDNTISILDEIGEGLLFSDGTTAKRISAALRSIGEKDVVVNINSPGGDMFEGLAIYNLLREHKGKITVKVLGLAASAASLIAMAGDEIQIAKSGFLMIHNCWVVAIGNRHHLRSTADEIESFDRSMAGIYADRTGIEQSAIEQVMDNETWLNGPDAVEKGWADSLLSSSEIMESEINKKAAHRLEQALAKAGLTRSERRQIINDYKATMPGAGSEQAVMPGADSNDMPGAVIGNDGLLALNGGLATLSDIFMKKGK
jgi:ATP-dependent protease ClpP protease subunit